MEQTVLIAIIFFLAGVASLVYYAFIRGETNTVWVVLFLIAGMLFSLNYIYNCFANSMERVGEEKDRVLEEIGNQD